MGAYLLEAFVLGISSGPVCVASCAPVLGPVLAVEGAPARASAGLLARFLAGRLAGYLGFAVVAWLAGVSLASAPRGRMLVFGLADIALSILLCSYGFAMRRPKCRYRNSAPAFLGFASGITLCPPLVAAGARAAERIALGESLLFFMAFFLGSALWFAPAVSVSLLRGFAGVAVVARFTLFLLAGYYGYMGLKVLVIWLR